MELMTERASTVMLIVEVVSVEAAALVVTDASALVVLGSDGDSGDNGGFKDED